MESLEAPSRAARAGAAVAFAAAVTAAGGWGGRYTSTGRWYRTLDKPPFQPPSWLFGPVWTVLYGLIATSGYRVWRRRGVPGRRRALALWALQLGLNALWTPLFFGRRRPRAALVDLALLGAGIAAYVHAAGKVDRGAQLAVLPYAAWSSFAFLLNEEIVRRNPSVD